MLKIGSIVKNLPSDVIWYVTDNGKTEQLFKCRPQKSSRDILQDTLRWLKKNERDFKKVFAHV
ncbi:MAG: hypothetical protein ABSB18_00595 [Candidatus Omnitrophota bacterium]